MPDIHQHEAKPSPVNMKETMKLEWFRADKFLHLNFQTLLMLSLP